MSYSNYEFDSHYLELGGLRLHYLDEGPSEGEPVVMVHGNPTWSFYYRNLVLAVRDAYRAIVPDHMGMGLSDKPHDSRYDYTLGSRVDDLEKLLEHLNVRSNITLVMHDWGGMIAMAYAVRHPERIRRLVVLNTAAFHLPAGRRFPRELAVLRLPAVGPLLVQGLNAFCRTAARRCVTRRPLLPGVRAGYLGPYDSWGNRRAVLRFVQDIPLEPGDRAYHAVSEVEANLHRLEHLPMLICWGLRDFIFDASFLEEWTGRFPRARVHRFEDAGHYVLEDAAEQIIPQIRQFLAT